jgi:Subtilase family
MESRENRSDKKSVEQYAAKLLSESVIAHDLPADVIVKLRSPRKQDALLSSLDDIVNVTPLFTDPPNELAGWLRLHIRSGADARTRVLEAAEKDPSVALAYLSPTVSGWETPSWRARLALQLHSLVSGLRGVVGGVIELILGAQPKPDYSLTQRYALSAPWGVGVVDVPGWPELNECSGLQIAVVDDGYYDKHPDLPKMKWVCGSESPSADEIHGTAALGVLCATWENNFGMVGLASGASVGFSYTNQDDGTFSVADAIYQAAAKLGRGDVLLIEQQSPGSGLPIEFDPGCFAAIDWAVQQGVVVVEPSGNGGQDLDALGDYFNRTIQDSGAIMVGHGYESPLPTMRARSREVVPGSMTKGNYGSRIDVQAFGNDVATTIPMTGYWGLHDVGFLDTSAASAIVAGAVFVASAVIKLLDPAGLLPLTDLRGLLVATGSPQHPEYDDQHVGPQPNLPALLRKVRDTLYAKYGVARPNAPPVPPLSHDERWALPIISSGVDDQGLADAMSGRKPFSLSDAILIRQSIYQRIGVGATALKAAAAAEAWGLL